MKLSVLLLVRLTASPFPTHRARATRRCSPRGSALPPPFFSAQLPLAVAQQFTTMNYTQYSDADCKTVKNSSEWGARFAAAAAARSHSRPPRPNFSHLLSPSLPELYTLDKCHKGLITSCTPGNATLVWYDDTTNKCTGAVNDTRTYVPGTCTQTGPKSARASKLVTCS